MGSIYSRTGEKSLASEMRNYVTVQSLARISDGEGGHRDTWSDTVCMWAAIYPIRVSQKQEMRKNGIDVTHTIHIRADMPIVEKTNRIVFSGRIFEVMSVENIAEHGIVKVVTCREAK